MPHPTAPRRLALAATLALLAAASPVRAGAQQRDTAARRTPPPPPPPPARVDSTMVAFLGGRWSCAGAFANGRPIEADLSFAPELGGMRLRYEHVDRAPSTWHAVSLWGIDAPTGTFVSVLHDNFGGTRLFTSEGWRDRRITFTAAPLLRPPRMAERFIYAAEAGDTFRMTWEIDRGSGWQLGDYLVCRRQR